MPAAKWQQDVGVVAGDVDRALHTRRVTTMDLQTNVKQERRVGLVNNSLAKGTYRPADARASTKQEENSHQMNGKMTTTSEGSFCKMYIHMGPIHIILLLLSIY